MFGSRKTFGAVSMPAIAPSIAASPQPRPSIHGTRTPTRRASDGLTAAARSASPTFVNWKNAQRTTTADRGRRRSCRCPDTRSRPRRCRSSPPGTGSARRAPRPSRSSHARPLSSSSRPIVTITTRICEPSLDRPDHDLVDPDAADERDEQRHDEGGPVREAVVRRQRPGMYVENVAISPWAKLITPVARWISTSASASAP